MHARIENDEGSARSVLKMLNEIENECWTDIICEQNLE